MLQIRPNREMHAYLNSWNKFVVALSSFLLLCVMAPRHDCFCGTIPSSSNSESHDCCSMGDEAKVALTNLSNTIQSASCCCAAEHNVFEASKNAQLNNETELIPKPTTVFQTLSLGCDQSVLYSQLHFQNDELKPSKLFLLNRSLLI